MAQGRAGRRVAVFVPDTGRVLFYARMADTSPPWQFWTRVVPEPGFIDLPPMYRVTEVPEEVRVDEPVTAAEERYCPWPTGPCVCPEKR